MQEKNRKKGNGRKIGIGKQSKRVVLSVCLPLLWQSSVGLQLYINGKKGLKKLHFERLDNLQGFPEFGSVINFLLSPAAVIFVALVNPYY